MAASGTRRRAVAAPVGDDVPMERPHAKVITVSDSVSTGERVDRAGPALVERLEVGGFRVDDHRVVADGTEQVADALARAASGFHGVVVTTGGTGFGPRDLTPEGTALVLEREAPGLAEASGSAPATAQHSGQ